MRAMYFGHVSTNSIPPRPRRNVMPIVYHSISFVLCVAVVVVVVGEGLEPSRLSPFEEVGSAILPEPPDHCG